MGCREKRKQRQQLTALIMPGSGTSIKDISGGRDVSGGLELLFYLRRSVLWLVFRLWTCRLSGRSTPSSRQALWAATPLRAAMGTMAITIIMVITATTAIGVIMVIMTTGATTASGGDGETMAGIGVAVAIPAQLTVPSTHCGQSGRT